MPVTKRPDTGHYQVTISFGGRTSRKTSRHWTFADAKAYERKWLASIKGAAAGRVEEKLIADGLERWLTEHVPRLRSARQTRNHARQLLPYIRGRKLGEIAQVWAEIKAAEIGKAPATTNNKGRILRQISRMAWLEWHWLEKPAAISLLPEIARETFLTRAQVDALVRACADRNAARYILLASYTGLRRGHLLRLTKHDVDGKFLRIDRSGKTRKLQLLPLHPRVQGIAGKLPLGVPSNRLQAEWTAARAACGLEHVRWHDLRHTCASWLVQAGVPIHTVGEFLGHTSTATTRRYAHLAPEHLSDALRKVK
jgi:integrase